MRDLRMLAFQLRQFAGTPYFVQVLAISTLSTVAVQWLISTAGTPLPDASSLVWLRAGCVGSWSVTCVAAGILGFQRYQGTLAQIVFSPLGAARGVFPVVASCAMFGLLAFPLAAAAAWLLGFRMEVADVPLLLAAMTAFAFGSVSLALTMAVLFLLSANAITYEGLLAIPVILLAGVFGYPEQLRGIAENVAMVIPLTASIRAMSSAISGTSVDPSTLLVSGAISLLVSAVWLLGATVALRLVVRRVRHDASLELV